MCVCVCVYVCVCVSVCVCAQAYPSNTASLKNYIHRSMININAFQQLAECRRYTSLTAKKLKENVLSHGEMLSKYLATDDAIKIVVITLHYNCISNLRP